MGMIIVRILGAAGAAILSVAVWGSGVATADLAGMSYADASEWINEHKGHPVVGTVSGNQVETADCTVASWHLSNFLNSSGENERKKDFVLNLNCNNAVASPGNPGNSAMSPIGAQAKKEQQAAAKINKNPSWCESGDEAMQYCETICKKTGLCEI
jgi:hypothetical protein